MTTPPRDGALPPSVVPSSTGRSATTRRDRRRNTPRAIQAGGRPPGRVIVCVGDSITAADMSADWIASLRSRFEGRRWSFVNAGVNGNLAWNVAQRIDEVIACDPDAVVLLIGTNDVAGTLNEKVERSYRRQQGIPQTPTLDWYRENIDVILRRLQAETMAKIAVIEIPLLGEDRDSEINTRVRAYNDALHAVAATHGVQVLPLHQHLVGLIPPGHKPTAYAHRTGPMLFAALQHWLLKRSWDDISRRSGLVITTDWVHLNDKAAAVLTDLVASFLNESLASAPA